MKQRNKIVKAEIEQYKDMDHFASKVIKRRAEHEEYVNDLKDQMKKLIEKK